MKKGVDQGGRVFPVRSPRPDEGVLLGVVSLSYSNLQPEIDTLPCRGIKDRHGNVKDPSVVLEHIVENLTVATPSADQL
jgi:hypothetical protein